MPDAARSRPAPEGQARELVTKCAGDFPSSPRRRGPGVSCSTQEVISTLLEQPADPTDVAQRRFQVLAHRLRRFLVAFTLEQVEDLQVLPAVLTVALAILHRSVRKQAPDAIDALHRVDEERVAARLDRSEERRVGKECSGRGDAE